MTSVRRSLATSVVLAALATAGCEGRVQDLPPHGEALFVVDTDLPAPELAGRLRVDLYSEEGVWFESRDIGRSDKRDWPASFSVYSNDDVRARRVLVRLRAYPEGVTRDYRGERFEARPTFTPPHVPQSLDELCATAPELPLGGRVTLRRGSRPLTDIVAAPTCVPPNRGGSVAARVVVPTQGMYGFDVAGADPYETRATLILRTDCMDPNSQIACRNERTAQPQSSGHFSRLAVPLDPGTYYMITTSDEADWPADITLEAMSLETADGELPPHVVDEPVSNAIKGPRLAVPGANSDPTPASEPLPSAAIDRLVAVRLAPGERGVVHVKLHADCAGTMAKLGADPTRVDLGSAETCIDTENVRVRVADTPLEEPFLRDTTSVHLEYVAGDACAPADSTATTACVPSGVFLFGSRLQGPFTGTTASMSPERIAVMSRFYMDKNEVTVGAVRAAIARGFAVPDGSIWFNDGPLALKKYDRNKPVDPAQWCTFSHEPLGREDMPVSCVSWSLARSYCQSLGGDLPTEAQFEYAGTAAARPRKTLFPWGDETPDCERASTLRFIGDYPIAGGDACSIYQGDVPVSVGPEPVTRHDGTNGKPGDVGALGIVNLSGSMVEWMLDSAKGFDDACWRAASLRDPRCVEDDGVLRVQRGGSWTGGAASAIVRSFLAGGSGGAGLGPWMSPSFGGGFRCAYAEAPRR